MKSPFSLRVGLLMAATAAVFIACGGQRSSLPPSAPMELRRLSTTAGSLTVALSLSGPDVNASTLNLYAYPLRRSGPLAKPSKRDLIATANVSNGSSNCSSSSGSRTCTISAAVPNGTDVIVGILFQSSQILAQSFTLLDVSGPATLDLEAGTTTLGSLSVIAPLAIKGSAFNVGVAAYAANGASIMIAPSTAITVNVYGPAGAVPQPQATVSGIGETASFTYSGQSFVNPMSVTAVTGTMSNTTQIFPRTSVPMACAPLAQSTVAPVKEPLIYSNGFNVWGSIAGAGKIDFSLDTGSTSLLIAKSKLSGLSSKEFVGPGQAAHENLEPSDITVYGNYYLAPVTLYNGSGVSVGTTVPMEILVTTLACGKGESPPNCPADTGSQYMGVGFGRPSPGPTSKSGGLMDTPLESTFMQLAPVVEGTMHPGFIMTPNTLQIGINQTSASGYPMVHLKTYPNRPGDWQGPTGCLRFNQTGSLQCGNLLLDIGIRTMFIHAATPSPLNNVEVISPNKRSPLMQYSFPWPLPASATPPAPDPDAKNPITWVSGSTPFVNTGRDALAAAWYLYDAGCGKVGFQNQLDR